jgi:DNA helicase-2/ATP-dependent DNA helicase PcrA
MENRFSQLYKTLNERQRLAVNTPHSTVVIAGPGSGKTRIVCLKAAKLCSQGIGVACISFGNATIEKIEKELSLLGVHDREYIYVGTVHTFCLNHVIHPFSNLLADSLPANPGIASETQSLRILYRVLTSNRHLHRVNLNGASGSDIRRNVLRYYNGELTCLRRSRVLGETQEESRILKQYDEQMVQSGLLDFEMIVEKAVQCVRNIDEVKRYIRERFPWFLIDEYQDLGGSLHALTLTLVNELDIDVLAVGDPNQMIYDFAGAREDYVEELKTHAKFSKPIETVTCYRFGNRLIAASKSVIGRCIPYIAHSNCTEGQLSFLEFGTLREQCDWIVSELVPSLIDKTDDPDSVAILYRQRGAVPDVIRRAIADPLINQSQIEYFDERNTSLPDSPIIRWLRECADWSMAFRTEDTASLNRFPQLIDHYLDLLRSARRRPSEDDIFQVELHLRNVLLKYSDLDIQAVDWIIQVCHELEINILLEQAGNRTGEIEDLKDLVETHSPGKLMKDLTLQAESGKVLFTTMHSSKGREFDYVILPGVQDHIMPWFGAENLLSSRRLFYVACTRAKKAVYVVYSNLTEPIEMPWGELQRCPASPFIDEMKNAIADYYSLSND